MKISFDVVNFELYIYIYICVCVCVCVRVCVSFVWYNTLNTESEFPSGFKP